MGFFYLLTLAVVAAAFALVIRDTWQTYERTAEPLRCVRVIPSVYDWEQEGAA